MTVRTTRGLWAAALVVIAAAVALVWLIRPQPPMAPPAPVESDRLADGIEAEATPTRRGPAPALPGFGADDRSEPSGDDDMGQRPLVELAAEVNRALELAGDACAEHATAGHGTRRVSVRYTLATIDGNARLAAVRPEAEDPGLERCLLLRADQIELDAPGSGMDRTFTHSFAVQVGMPR